MRYANRLPLEGRQCNTLLVTAILMACAPQANESHSSALHSNSWRPYCFSIPCQSIQDRRRQADVAAFGGKAPLIAVHFHHNGRNSPHCKESSTSLGRPEHEINTDFAHSHSSNESISRETIMIAPFHIAINSFRSRRFPHIRSLRHQRCQLEKVIGSRWVVREISAAWHG